MTPESGLGNWQNTVAIQYVDQTEGNSSLIGEDWEYHFGPVSFVSSIRHSSDIAEGIWNYEISVQGRSWGQRFTFARQFIEVFKNMRSRCKQ